MNKRKLIKNAAVSVWSTPLIYGMNLPSHAAMTPVCSSLGGLCNVTANDVPLPDGFSYFISVSLAGEFVTDGMDASVQFLRFEPSISVFNTPVVRIGCLGGFYQGEVSTDLGSYTATMNVAINENFEIPDPRRFEIDLTIDVIPVNGDPGSVNIDLTNSDDVDCFIFGERQP